MLARPASSHSLRSAASRLQRGTDFVPVAVIVAFDPARDAHSAARVAARFVRHVVLVDNAPLGHPSPQSGEDDANVTPIRNANKGGLAGAYNAALKWIARHRPDATHVLWLDDDTDPHAIEAFLTSATTRAILQDDTVAAVAPAYRERATGLRGSHIQLERWSYRFLPRELLVPAPVTFLINSMSLWKRSALSAIGPFSEVLAVDHVDTDFCLRAKLLGYKLVLDPEIEFLHSIGARRSYRFLGRTLQSGGHAPSRRRTIAKNTVLLAKRHAFRFPAFMALCLLRLTYEAVGVVAVEDDKSRKLGSLVAGGISGLFSRLPPTEIGETTSES